MKRGIFAALFVIVLVVVFTKDKLIEVAIERMGTFVTGAKVDIGSMKTGIIKPAFDIMDLKVYNPEGFERGVMADIPEIHVEYDPLKLFKGTVHVKKFGIYLKELNIVKNREGRVNLGAINPVKNSSSGAEMEKENRGKMPDIDIDSLHLKADKVVYRDYTSARPVTRTFDVNIDETFENIKDPYTLVRLIAARVLKNTAISNIINIPMNGVKGIMDKALGTTGTTFKKAEKGLGGLVSGVFSTISAVGK
ncbi:MAG: hypothetical protein ABIA77_04145 [Candidatus Omnitrophota bacterium]